MIQKLYCALPLSTAVLMTTSSALAQQASGPYGDLNSSNEIIVTATKTSQSISNLGLSVSVIEGEALDRLNSAEDLTQYLSGVQAAVANGNQIAFQIRGIGAVDHQALTPTAAAVYIDGVFQATNVQTGPLLFDTERAEVLKGPQGSLYGRNATAGAINFISKRPDSTQDGYISGEYGTFDRVNVNAAVNIPAGDIFSLRLSGRYLSQGPTLDNVVTDAAISAPKDAGGKRDEFGLRALGLLTPSDKTEVLINAHYAEDNGINPAPRNEGLSLGRHEISVGPAGIQDTDNEFYGTSVNVVHDFGQAELSMLTAYEGYNQQYGFDFAALPQFFGGQTANLSYDRDFTQVSHEMRLAVKRGKVDAMAGLYLEAEDFDQEYRVWCGQLNLDTLVGSCNYIAAASRVGGSPTPAGARASTLQSLITQERKTGALFTYNTVELDPKLSLTLGARLTREIIKGRGRGNHIFDTGEVGLNNRLETDASGNRIVVGPAIGSNKISELNFSGNIGLNYKITPRLLTYVSASNGFKSGGFNGEVINNASHFDDEGLFGSETVNAAELGAKYVAEDISFNVAGFFNDYNDPQARFFQQVTLDNGQTIGLNSLSNFNAAQSYGLEGDIRVTPFSGLNLTASATWLKSEIKDKDQPTLNGNPLPFASEFSGAMSASYEWALSDKLDAGLHINGKYQSQFSTGASLDSAADFLQKGYERIDGRAVLGVNEAFEIGIWGRNLTNSDYAISAYRFFGPTTFRGDPLSYGVMLGYEF